MFLSTDVALPIRHKAHLALARASERLAWLRVSAHPPHPLASETARLPAREYPAIRHSCACVCASAYPDPTGIQSRQLKCKSLRILPMPPELPSFFHFLRTRAYLVTSPRRSIVRYHTRPPRCTGIPSPSMR